MVWTKTTRKALWWVLMLGLSVPLLWLLYNWVALIAEAYNLRLSTELGFHDLTANPIEYTNRFLGDWALRFLLFAFAITPLARLTGQGQFIAYRRMIGLWAFTYVLFHLTSYIVLDQFFSWQDIWQDIVKRNFITFGMISFLLLLPMAVTSTKGWVKRLGAKRWKKIHRAIYIVAPLTTFHYFMMSKGNQLDPKIYIGIAMGLLAIRVWFYHQDKIKTATKKAAV